MQRRNIIILTFTSLAGVMLLVGLFAWFGRLWIGVLLVLLVVLCQILVAIYLSLYQRRQQRTLERESFRLREQLEALEVIDQREQRAAELLLTKQLYEKRLEELAALYCQNLRDDTDLYRIKLLESFSLLSVYVQPHLRLITGSQKSSSLPSTASETFTDPQSILLASIHEMEQQTRTILEPEYAITHFKHCVILGEPGTGKTLFLKYCALKAASGEFGSSRAIPLYIDLQAFANTEQDDLLQFAVRSWDTYGFPENDALPYLKKRLQGGSALVLLDTLDEALIRERPQKVRESYERLIFNIKCLALDYPQALIVVAARSVESQQFRLLPHFTHLQLSGFNERNVEQFVRQWFGSLRSTRYRSPTEQVQQGNRLLEEFRRVPEFRSLTAHPLLLTLLVMLYEKRVSPLPVQLAEIYQKCSDLLLTQHNSRGSDADLPGWRIEQQRSLLEQTAWHFHKRRKRYFSEDELLELPSDSDAYPVTLLLREQSSSMGDKILFSTYHLREEFSGQYAFLHSSFQEYFAASFVVKNTTEVTETLLKHRNDLWWENVILFYTSKISDATPFVRRLFGRPQSYIDLETSDALFLSHLIMAGKCLTVHPTFKTQPSLFDEIVTRLLRDLQRTHYSFVREQLADVLARVNNPHINALLLQLLQEERVGPEVHESIVSALGLYANPEVMDELFSMLLDERVEDKLRLHIIQVVVEAQLRSATARFLKCVADRWVSSSVRLKMAQAVGWLIEDEQEANEVVGLLSHKKLGIVIRCALVDSLGMAGLSFVLPALALLYKEEHMGSPLSWHLAIALASLGEATELTVLLSSCPTFSDHLGEVDYSTILRMATVRSIGTPHQSPLTDRFLALLPDEHIAWEWRVCAVNILEGLGERSLLPALFSLLAQKEQIIDSRVRSAIALLAASLGGSQALESLRKIPTSYKEDPRVYRSLLTARGRLGDQTVTNFLLDWVIRDTDPVAETIQPEDCGLSVAERLTILTALEDLCEFNRSDNPYYERFFVTLCLLARSPEHPQELREQAILKLPLSIRNADEKEQVETLLTELFNDASVQDDAHRALWMFRKHWPDGAAEALYL